MTACRRTSAKNCCHGTSATWDASAAISVFGSAGGAGDAGRAYFGASEQPPRASIAPLSSVISTVGSGDAFLAGFVSARFQKLDLSECLRQGLAAGAANTQRYGAGVLDAGTAAELLESTEVKESSLRS